jgi:hypothetical protein
MTLVETATYHSTLIAYFDTGGWRVEIREVNKLEVLHFGVGSVLLLASYCYYTYFGVTWQALQDSPKMSRIRKYSSPIRSQLVSSYALL